jgi:hypothetical protein
MKKITGILILVLLTVSNHAMAKDRIVKCQIDSNSESGKVETIYKGSCSFSPEAKNGSFSLGNAEKDKPLTKTIYSVNVSITEKDVAEVFGSVVGGNNSRWGEAKRSTKDKACWEGVDFKVCAW